MASTSTTSFRLCTATRRYFLLRDGIFVLLADEEDESELSALIAEQLGMYWSNREKDTTMHNTYQGTRNKGKASTHINA